MSEDKTFYLLEGPVSGPLVVCIHGIGFDLHTFELFSPALVASGFRVLRYDWHGIGGSPACERYTLTAHKNQLRVLLTELNVEPKAIVAHSLGATVAVAAAAEMPTLAALVLLAPAGAMAAPFPLFKQVQRIARGASCVCLPLLTCLLAGPPPPGDIILDRSLLCSEQKQFDLTEAKALEVWLLAWHKESTQTRPLVERMARMPIVSLKNELPVGSFQGSATQVLIMSGAADKTVTAIDRQFFSSCFPERCHFDPPHPLGHCFHLQDPETVHERVLSFLRSVVEEV